MKYKFRESGDSFNLEDLRSYLKEETSRIQINPRLKKSYFEETSYAILEGKELEGYSKSPYILGRAKVRLTILNKPTQNLTFYSQEWADKSILGNNQFQEKLNKKLILGETDHPTNPDGSIKNISHSVIKVWLENNNLWGIAEIYNTPNGQLLWTLLNAGVILGVSSRGLGDDYFEDGVKKIKAENFEMIGWDFVINASNIGAEFVEFSEDKKRDVMNKIENINKNYNDDISGKILDSFAKDKKVVEEMKQLKDKVVEFENKIVSEKEKFNVLFNANKKQIQENKNLEKRIKSLEEDIKIKSNMLVSKEEVIKVKDIEKIQLEDKVRILEDEIINKKSIIEKNKIEMENLKVGRQSKTYNLVLNETKKDEDKKEINIFKSRSYKYNK